MFFDCVLECLAVLSNGVFLDPAQTADSLQRIGIVCLKSNAPSQFEPSRATAGSHWNKRIIAQAKQPQDAPCPRNGLALNWLFQSKVILDDMAWILIDTWFSIGIEWLILN